jgi:hypothetical protein
MDDVKYQNGGEVHSLLTLAVQAPVFWFDSISVDWPYKRMWAFADVEDGPVKVYVSVGDGYLSLHKGQSPETTERNVIPADAPGQNPVVKGLYDYLDKLYRTEVDPTGAKMREAKTAVAKGKWQIHPALRRH